MKRSTFIAAASGYFLARAGGREASRLADEVFSSVMARVPRERDRARVMEASDPESARNHIIHALERDAEAISSVMNFAPGDKALEEKVEGLVDQLSGAWLLLTGRLSQQRKGDRITFTIEQREPARPQVKPRNPKEASRPRTIGGEFRRVPTRKVTGPMQVYYYDYISDHANGADTSVVERVSERPDGGVILYEILNLVDGKRSVQEIRDYLSAAYGAVRVEDVNAYLALLEKIGVVTLGDKN